MKAVVPEATGGPEQLRLREVPEPTAGVINFADVLIRLGRYPQMPDLPAVLGSEIADEVAGKRVFVRAEGGGYAGGLWEDVSPAWLVGRNIGVHGFYLGRLTALRPDLVERAAHDVLRLWQRGVVRPVVGAEFPLAEAGEAHRLVEERKTTGKAVLIP